MSSEMGHYWSVKLDLWPDSLAMLNTIHLNTVIMAWAAMVVVLVIALLIRFNLQLVPSRLQVFGELMFNFCKDMVVTTGGPKAQSYVFFVGSLFMFIVTANLMGQLPLRLIHIPQGELIAATGDLNTPVALAIMVVFAYFIVGIGRKGLGYFKHYVYPHWAFAPLNALEDVTKPFSLSIRLFANILVGEILAGITLSILPIGLPVATIMFELFVAVLQAFIFAMLSSVYIALVSAEDH